MSGVVSREVSQALGDDHVASWEQIGENAVGSALGAPVGNALFNAYERHMASAAYGPSEPKTPLPGNGQAAYDSANPLSRYNAAGAGAALTGPGDQEIASYMSAIAANPQAMLAYEPGNDGQGYGDSPLGRVGPPPIMSTEGDMVYAGAAAASEPQARRTIRCWISMSGSRPPAATPRRPMPATS